MKIVNSWKNPIRACIEIDNVLHELVAGNETCAPNHGVSTKVEGRRQLLEGINYMQNFEIQEPKFN